MPSYLVPRTLVVQIQSSVNMVHTPDLPLASSWGKYTEVGFWKPLVLALVVWAKLTLDKLQLFCGP